MSELLENTLLELEKTRSDFWNLDRYCANFLNILIKTKNAKNILEIGTSNGYSGLWILEALSYTKGKLTTIEFWEKRQSIARKNFALCFPNVEVEPKIGSALVVLEDLAIEIENKKREKFDFVFIDASKKEYLDYFLLVDKIIQKNALIVADNILSHKDKVQNYIDALMADKNYQSQILDIGSGMMFSIRK